MNTTAMVDGRRADTARRRQRVIKALNTAAGKGDELSVSAIARAAGVDRTFLYRHRDLLAQIHAAEATPPPTADHSSSVSRASLQADLAHAQDRTARQSARIRQLENKLAEVLGEQVWQDSGLGAVEDVDALKRSVTMLEQQVVDLTEQLDERQQELDAARATNRDLMARLNRTPRPTG